MKLQIMWKRHQRLLGFLQIFSLSHCALKRWPQFQCCCYCLQLQTTILLKRLCSHYRFFCFFLVICEQNFHKSLKKNLIPLLVFLFHLLYLSVSLENANPVHVYTKKKEEYLLFQSQLSIESRHMRNGTSLEQSLSREKKKRANVPIRKYSSNIHRRTISKFYHLFEYKEKTV